MSGFEHACQRSEDDEAVIRNLAIFSHLSGENRARMGWPASVMIFALRLAGDVLHAELLAMEEARRSHHRARVVAIPHQRKPHPLESRKPRPSESRVGVPSEPVRLGNGRFGARTDIDNNRGGR